MKLLSTVSLMLMALVATTAAAAAPLTEDNVVQSVDADNKEDSVAEVVPKMFHRPSSTKQQQNSSQKEKPRKLWGSVSADSRSDNTCGDSCTSDRDCDDDCPKCHKTKDKWGKYSKFGTCIDDSSVKSSSARADDTCGDQCTSDSECGKGECSKCLKHKDKWGTEYKHGTCVVTYSGGRSDNNGNGYCGLQCGSNTDCGDDCNTCHKQKDKWGTTYKFGKCVEGKAITADSRSSGDGSRWSKWESKDSVKERVETCGNKCTSDSQCNQGDDGCDKCYKKKDKWGKSPKYGVCE